MNKSHINYKPQETQIFYTDRIDEREADETLVNAGCFHSLSCLNWWRRRTNNADDKLLLNHSSEKQKDSWLVQKLKSVKEVSEVIAGPKWKNFVRKLGAYFNQGNNNKCEKKMFQYDSYTYALNFDDPGQGDDDDDRLFAGFSARFAPPSKHDQRQSGL